VPVFVSMQLWAFPTVTANPEQEGDAVPMPGDDSANAKVQVCVTPSTRISIRCIPVGKLPSSRFATMVKLSKQPTKVQALVMHPAAANPANAAIIPTPIKQSRMPEIVRSAPNSGYLPAMPPSSASSSNWPELRVAAWRDTYATLLLYGQIVGKIRLALTPKLNEWWNVTFYVTARGFTTSPMPYGDRLLSIDFDFIDHRLVIQDSQGQTRVLPLEAKPVCFFYADVMNALAEMGPSVHIWPQPQECPVTTPFSDDREHAHYDRAAVRNYWEALRRIEPVFQQFRARFRGKCSPVHFFWGAFDLAVSRFVGRRAPERKGKVERDAYDEEVISLGFWPGDPWAASGNTDAMFYSYTVPEPAGLATDPIRPAAAGWNATLKEFVLPYEDVRRASDPAAAILDFAQSCYDAGAIRAGWNREALAYP